MTESAQSGQLYATLKTTAGDIVLRLFEFQAPKTVRNFTGLADGSQAWADPQTGEQRTDPFYQGLGFHRVIAGFMIQGGCPRGDGRGSPGYRFDDEIHPELQFDRPYLLAMANAGKHMGRGTNGSQFFITVSKPTGLNGKHTIFGEVADDDSRTVVDAIATTPVDPSDKPVDPVTINEVVVERRSS